MPQSDKPPVRCLFEGPSGAAQANAAELLGERLGVPVFRIDVSAVAAKYIGETEKNPAEIFNRAQAQGAILFFDEGDALFGKRSAPREATKPGAEPPLSGVMRQIENYPGIVIVAADCRGSMDEAFARRFRWVVPFPKPAE